jgi:hypothetical protein
MARVCLLLVGLVFVARSLSAQPPPPTPFIIDMPAGAAQMPQGPPRDNAQPAKAGTATLRGHVVAADTGQPLRKAQVRVMSGELRENRMTTTDGDGKYEFKELPAGRYNVMASKGSYVNLNYGQQRPFEPGKPLEILDGQTIEKVDFSLPRGGVITGRILDEFGEPLADAQVMAQRYQTMAGRRRLVPAGRPAMTNDIGEFRLFAIPPGQYYLSATLRNMGMIGDSDDRSGYAPTYFPGTANMAEAQRLTIGIGQTVSDINMALMPARTARITGTAVDSQGRAMMGMVMAVPLGDSAMTMFGPPGQVKPDGAFAIGGLAPGSYKLQTMGPGDGESASVEVSISGDDISGIRLVGSKPSIASGRIIVDAAAATALKPALLRLMAQPAVFDNMMFGPPAPPAQVNDDLTFELKSRPGKMRIGFAGPAVGWTIRTVRYRGVDVTDAGIDFRPNEDIADVEVEITNRVTDLSGMVTNSRGEPVKDYSVAIFPEDRDKWTPGSRYLRSGRPDQGGRFKLTSMPPGEYFIIALDYMDANEWTEPEFLERIRAKATRLSIGEGETKSVDLKVTNST